MTVLFHYTDLAELQQSLLAAYLYFMLIGDVEAAEVYGDQFDKLYHYDNSHENKLKTTNTHTL